LDVQLFDQQRRRSIVQYAIVSNQRLGISSTRDDQAAFPTPPPTRPRGGRRRLPNCAMADVLPFGPPVVLRFADEEVFDSTGLAHMQEYTEQILGSIVGREGGLMEERARMLEPRSPTAASRSGFNATSIAPRCPADALRIFTAPYMDPFGMLEDFAMSGSCNFP
jgi:hypothetical protein